MATRKTGSSGLFAVASQVQCGAILPFDSLRKLIKSVQKEYKKLGANGIGFYTIPFNGKYNDIRLRIIIYRILNAEEFDEIREAMNPVLERHFSCRLLAEFEVVIENDLLSLRKI